MRKAPVKSSSDVLYSIDASLRSVGVVGFLGEEVHSFRLIQREEEDDEKLLLGIAQDLCAMLAMGPYPTAVVIEGLAFASSSGMKDIISGLHWVLRCETHRQFPTVPIGVIPPSAWFKHTFPIEEQREWKKKDLKGWRKLAAVEKLREQDPFLLSRFATFVENESTKAKKKTAIFDLVDAYFMGKYRLSLDKGGRV